MKYTQLIIGLLAGTALGGAVVASSGPKAGADAESIKRIVREVIANEPELILESVQNYQITTQKKQAGKANDAVKDEAIRAQLYANADAPSHGPKDSKRTVVEFYDYNCGVCKSMFGELDALVKADPSVRVIFIEYPIFGPTSETNSKIALAVHRLYPDKFYDFHAKMMTNPARGTDEKAALAFAESLGMDAKKISAEAATDEVTAILTKNRSLGDTLHVQGTPMLIVGDEIVPHAMRREEMEQILAKVK